MLYLVLAAVEAVSFAAYVCITFVEWCAGVIYTAGVLLVELGNVLLPALMQLLWALCSAVSYVVETIVEVSFLKFTFVQPC